jgi:WD40 repeat protein
MRRVEMFGRRRRAWIVGGAVIAAAAIALSVVSSRAPLTPEGAAPVTGSPAIATAPTATVAPSATASGSPSATPFAAEPADVTGVRVKALGTLRGNWVFAAKLIQGSLRGSLEVWALPLDGGSPRLAFSYAVPIGGVPEAIFDVAPYLRRQFSPDGRRVVVSVNGELVVIDLALAQSRRLGVSGYYPSWSKDGSRIAFVAPLPVGNFVPPDNAILVVPAGGGAPREVARIGQSRQAAEWSPDGSLLAVEKEDNGARRVAIFDAATGQLLRQIDRSPSAGVTLSFAHWRSTQPQLALTTAREDEWAIIVLDTAAASERILGKTARQPDTSPCRCPKDPVPHDPRWNPVTRQELLYSLDAGDGSISANTRILDVETGKEIVLPITAGDATWTWDGRQVVYLAREGSSRGTAVRLWDRDAGSERELLARGSNSELFTAIASLGYGP